MNKLLANHCKQSIYFIIFQAANYSRLKALLEQQGGQLTVIENKMQGMTGDMAAFNNSVQRQIANVQKMTGPTGPKVKLLADLVCLHNCCNLRLRV